MKKLLGIIVLGLLLSGNAFAEKISQFCKDVRNPPLLESFKLTLNKDARTVRGEMIYTDSYLVKNNLQNVKNWSRVYKISRIDGQSLTYTYTNLARWNNNYKWVVKTGNGNKKSWDVNNKKSLKKLRKLFGPDDWIISEVVWNYKEEGKPLIQTHNQWSKKKNKIKSVTNKEQFICFSNAGLKKYNQEEKQEIILKASNKMKEEIEPFKTMCRNIGYSDGTEKFADCVKDLYLKKLDAEQSQAPTSTTTFSQPKRRIDPSVWDDLLGISKGLLGGKSGSSSSSSSLSCFKTSERVSGTNKICSYNCMGSEVTRNIRSTQICPMSIKK